MERIENINTSVLLVMKLNVARAIHDLLRDFDYDMRVDEPFSFMLMHQGVGIHKKITDQLYKISAQKKEIRIRLNTSAALTLYKIIVDTVNNHNDELLANHIDLYVAFLNIINKIDKHYLINSHETNLRLDSEKYT